MITLLNIDLETPVTVHDIDDELYPNSLIPARHDDQDRPAEPTANSPFREAGFWRRQFGDELTRGQMKFDWIFGVLLPVICIYCDPFIFRNLGIGRNTALLGKIAPLAYVLSFTAILGTMAWLLWGEKLGGVNASLSGVFAVSSLVALAIGVYIAPYSFIGLVLVFGALGFTPFFTSFVLLRNSIRSFRSAKPSLETGLLVNSFALAALAGAVIPYLINLLYSRH
jgi:hypothetical protein